MKSYYLVNINLLNIYHLSTTQYCINKVLILNLLFDEKHYRMKTHIRIQLSWQNKQK